LREKYTGPGISPIDFVDKNIKKWQIMTVGLFCPQEGAYYAPQKSFLMTG
jgi:hypothetical protein